MRPVVKTPGGKFYCWKTILKYVKPHHTWIEPFFGGGSVTLNKNISPVEIANDLNSELINLYKVIQTDLDNLISFINEQVEYTKEWFDWACEFIDDDSDNIRAVKYLIRNRFSRDGMGKVFVDSQRLRGGIPENRNAFQTIIESIPKIQKRINKISFHNKCALEILLSYKNDKDCCVMLDPPYITETRTKNLYGQYEVDDTFQLELLKLIKDAKFQCLLCGYDNVLYNNNLKDWKRIEYTKSVNMGANKKKGKRTEILWVKN